MYTIAKRYSLGCSIDNVYATIFTGYPTFVYDGLEDGWPISTFESTFLARQEIPTDVTIDFTAVQLTVWAQETLPSDPAEISQAQELVWPFSAGALFADGFESGTAGAWTETTL